MLGHRVAVLRLPKLGTCRAHLQIMLSPTLPRVLEAVMSFCILLAFALQRNLSKSDGGKGAPRRSAQSQFCLA